MKTILCNVLWVVFALFSVTANAQLANTEVIFTDFFDDEVEVYKTYPNNEKLQGVAHVSFKGEPDYHKQYVVEHLSDKPMTLGQVLPKIELNNNQDLVIEAKLAFIDGERRAPFGIFFIDSDKNQFIVTVSGNGYSQMVPNPDNIPLKEITTNYSILNLDRDRTIDAFRKDGGLNSLVVIVQKNSFSFYVNRSYQGKREVDIKWPIYAAGYYLEGKLTIGTDLFQCSKLNKYPKADVTIDNLIPSSDGKHLISNYFNRYLVWDTETGQRTDSISIENFGIIINSELKNYVVSGYINPDNEFLCLKETKTNNPIYTIPFKGLMMDPIIFDNNTLVIQDEKLKTISFYDLKTGAFQKTIKLKVKDEPLMFMADSQYGYFKYHNLKKIDVITSKVVYDVPCSNYQFSKDLTMFYTFDDRHIASYNANTGVLVNQKAFDGFSEFSEYAVSNDNKLMAVTDYYIDDVLSIIDLDEFKILKQYSMRYKIGALAFDPNLQYIYVGLKNGELHKINIATGESELMFGTVEE